MSGQPWCKASAHDERLVAGGRCSCHDYGVELNWRIKQARAEYVRLDEARRAAGERLDELAELRNESRKECHWCQNCSMCQG